MGDISEDIIPYEYELVEYEKNKQEGPPGEPICENFCGGQIRFGSEECRDFCQFISDD